MPRDLYLATKPPNMQAAQPARQPRPLPLGASDVLVVPLEFAGLAQLPRQIMLVHLIGSGVSRFGSLEVAFVRDPRLVNGLATPAQRANSA